MLWDALFDLHYLFLLFFTRWSCLLKYKLFLLVGLEGTNLNNILNFCLVIFELSVITQ